MIIQRLVFQWKRNYKYELGWNSVTIAGRINSFSPFKDIHCFVSSTIRDYTCVIQPGIKWLHTSLYYVTLDEVFPFTTNLFLKELMSCSMLQLWVWKIKYFHSYKLQYAICRNKIDPTLATCEENYTNGLDWGFLFPNMDCSSETIAYLSLLGGRVVVATGRSDISVERVQDKSRTNARVCTWPMKWFACLYPKNTDMGS